MAAYVYKHKQKKRLEFNINRRNEEGNYLKIYKRKNSVLLKMNFEKLKITNI